MQTTTWFLSMWCSCSQHAKRCTSISVPSSRRSNSHWCLLLGSCFHGSFGGLWLNSGCPKNHDDTDWTAAFLKISLSEGVCSQWSERTVPLRNLRNSPNRPDMPRFKLDSMMLFAAEKHKAVPSKPFDIWPQRQYASASFLSYFLAAARLPMLPSPPLTNTFLLARGAVGPLQSAASLKHDLHVKHQQLTARSSLVTEPASHRWLLPGAN